MRTIGSEASVEQSPYRGEGLPVYGAGSQTLQPVQVRGRRIAHVLRETVAGMLFVERPHHRVARGLRQDRGG
jgi:hypothetical protein